MQRRGREGGREGWREGLRGCSGNGRRERKGWELGRL